jgi:hypothetical protein
LKIEQGENIYYVQRQMGHSSIQVTIDIYGHLLETRKPDAAERRIRCCSGCLLVLRRSRILGLPDSLKVVKTLLQWFL